MIRGSQGRSQPPRVSSRSTSSAVKPQISIEPMWNAGPVRPLGCRNMNRCAGSASSATGIRSTAATSPMSAGRTAEGFRHQASTGTTRNWLRSMNSSGSMPSTSTPAGSRPVSSAASRSAAATGPSSESSIAPPGKAGCPACRRSPSLRWMNRRSGPSGPAPKRISTADRLPPDVGGRITRGTSMAAAAAASSRSHSGAWFTKTGLPLPAWPRSPRPSGRVRTMGTSPPPGTRRKPACGRGRSAGRARSAGATA